MVSADARLIGVRMQDAVYLQSVAGASKFTRDSWLQYWAAGMPLALPQDGEAADGAVACRKDACLLRPVPHAKAALLVAWRDASGRLRGCIGDRLGGAGARPMSAALACTGRSLHRLAERRNGDLAGRQACPHRD